MKKLTLPERKAIAIARYDEAMADPAATLERWRTVATMLRALVTTRASTAAPPTPSDAGAFYASWHARKMGW